ncbi:hypothetical protein NM208_g988 [Fusarium decemcellulare]|uniref:Uncharacterized protein n=2 Tax=Fusarium decemcellulare TaxID=57161 RepID=A0ACC1S754_9HYPO|nr:hypothetical protein NM208_g7990 [Fusarium decemcellulare]KAJ3548476.1 hypothetical protein NM208_g988 [Fusarium decemcellulare]
MARIKIGIDQEELAAVVSINQCPFWGLKILCECFFEKFLKPSEDEKDGSEKWGIYIESLRGFLSHTSRKHVPTTAKEARNQEQAKDAERKASRGRPRGLSRGQERAIEEAGGNDEVHFGLLEAIFRESRKKKGGPFNITTSYSARPHKAWLPKLIGSQMANFFLYADTAHQDAVSFETHEAFCRTTLTKSVNHTDFQPVQTRPVGISSLIAALGEACVVLFPLGQSVALGTPPRIPSLTVALSLVAPPGPVKAQTVIRSDKLGLRDSYPPARRVASLDSMTTVRGEAMGKERLGAISLPQDQAYPLHCFFGPMLEAGSSRARIVNTEPFTIMPSPSRQVRVQSHSGTPTKTNANAETPKGINETLWKGRWYLEKWDIYDPNGTAITSDIHSVLTNFWEAGILLCL